VKIQMFTCSTAVTEGGTVIMTSSNRPLAAPDWKRAACQGLNTELFYPGVHADPRPARKVCRACTITTGCLEWALAKGDEWGILGGTTARQRAAIRRQRQAQSAQSGASGDPERGRLLTLVAGYLNNRPTVAFTATELATGLHRDLPDVTGAVQSLVTTGRARLVDTRPHRYGAAGEVPARLGQGRLRAAVRAHFESLPPGTEVTCTEVTLAINSTSRRAVSAVLRWLADNGELHRHPSSTATRYTAAALKSGTEATTTPRTPATSPQTLAIRDDVLTYLRHHPTGIASAAEIARATRHCRTAVINALTWLTDQQQVRQVTERPRRYSAVDTASTALAS
jgi:WhiB family redox-sensing transcriptional regulator